jgi:hypothetical protein
MEQNMTERLAAFLQEKKTDFISMSETGKDGRELKKRLGLKGSVKKAVAPHLGERLIFKKAGNSTYLCFNMPDDILMFRIVQARAGLSPKAMSKNIPFKKDDFLAVLNRLSERGAIRAMKFNKDFMPLLYPAEEKPGISEKTFRDAFQELESGKFYVRICDMRRRLNWPAQEFDAMLKNLRDAGQLQLQGGDTDFFTKQDMQDSFVDENGFIMLTMKWRQ